MAIVRQGDFALADQRRPERQQGHVRIVDSAKKLLSINGCPLCSKSLPCVLAQSGGRMVLLLTADTIRRCNGSIADLRGRLGIHAAMRDLFFPGDSAPRARPERAIVASELRAQS